MEKVVERYIKRKCTLQKQTLISSLQNDVITKLIEIITPAVWHQIHNLILAPQGQDDMTGLGEEKKLL